MILNKGDHDILYPFGDFIYRGKLNEDEIVWIQNLAEKSRDGNDASDHLVGNMKDQRRPDPNPDTQKFIKIFHPHILNYYKHLQEKTKVYLENSYDEVSGFSKFMNADLNTMRYRLQIGMWFNYMKANEFNPIHAHNGEISAICMVKIPEEIKNELKNPEPDRQNFKMAGKLEFIGGSANEAPYQVTSETGYVYLFPANMRHQVYPFHSDVERITSSWNYINIEMDQKKS